MKNTPYNFPPLSPNQIDLLEKIKAEKEKLRTLSPHDPIPGVGVPELEEINKKIDELSVKAVRSGLLRGLSAESRHPGFRLIFEEIPGSLGEDEYEMRVLPGAGDFHPDLPPWAVKHFIEWIQIQRLRKGGRKNLRKTKLVGLETGMKRPRDLKLFFRTVELRGVEEKGGPEREDSPTPEAWDETLEKSRKLLVTEEMLRNAEEQHKAEEKKRKSRIRKEIGSWNWVIKKLVEEGLVEKVKTQSGIEKNPSVQAFKKMLKNHYPYYPWDEI
jgi:hypothetical protein